MIRICGVPFRFEKIEDAAEIAAVLPHKQIIQIDVDEHGNETVESAIFHEVIHQMDDQFALELGERGTRVLEASLFEALQSAGIDFSPLLDRIAEDTA